MTYQLPTLIRMVRTAMGINEMTHPMIRCRDPDTADLDHIIAQSLPAAAARIFADAPLSALTECAKDIGTDAIYWHDPIDDTYGGHIYLPDDYMRLLIFEMSDWDVPVTSLLNDKPQFIPLFYSKYAAIGGTCQSPRCLVTETSEGHRLDFRSCHTPTEGIARAKYVAYPRIDRHGGMTIPCTLLDKVINEAKSAVAQIFNT